MGVVWLIWCTVDYRETGEINSKQTRNCSSTVCRTLMTHLRIENLPGEGENVAKGWRNKHVWSRITFLLLLHTRLLSTTPTHKVAL